MRLNLRRGLLKFCSVFRGQWLSVSFPPPGHPLSWCGLAATECIYCSHLPSQEAQGQEPAPGTLRRWCELWTSLGWEIRPLRAAFLGCDRECYACGFLLLNAAGALNFFYNSCVWNFTSCMSLYFSLKCGFFLKIGICNIVSKENKVLILNLMSASRAFPTCLGSYRAAARRGGS